MQLKMNRRGFVLGILAASLADATTSLAAVLPGAPEADADDKPGARLAPWRPGCLDIHHIATGRGNATFILMPDGTSLLIDAGASADALDVSVATRPNPGRRAGEWIGRYALRHLGATGRASLDYLLLTHLHPDHLGDIAPGLPLSSHGDYRLTGIMDVAEMLPIGTLIDRGFPDYAYPSAQTAPFAANYLAYVRARVALGLAVERFRVGSDTQIGARGHFPTAVNFDVRNGLQNFQRAQPMATPNSSSSWSTLRRRPAWEPTSTTQTWNGVDSN
jgi:hypothetical protein